VSDTGSKLTHPDPRIVVRSAVEPRKRYTEYRQELRKDFFYSCAYCTMTEFEAQSIRMTIDHYEPRKAREDLENDYRNLMYACSPCNERKGDRCPPAEARENGHRFFRADEEPRAAHFDIQGKEIKHLTNVGEFTIKVLDLNSERLQLIRDVRNRMSKCLPLVAEGILALRSYPIDQLPAYIRTRALRAIDEMTDFAASMQEDTDAVLMSFAKSDVIDPDETSDDRTKKREEYMKGLNALYPNSGFRAPRRGRRR
jgi:5-methylcytosine-specific restriction endonuclease McrA